MYSIPQFAVTFSSLWQFSRCSVNISFGMFLLLQMSQERYGSRSSRLLPIRERHSWVSPEPREVLHMGHLMGSPGEICRILSRQNLHMTCPWIQQGTGGAPGQVSWQTTHCKSFCNSSLNSNIRFCIIVHNFPSLLVFFCCFSFMKSPLDLFLFLGPILPLLSLVLKSHWKLQSFQVVTGLGRTGPSGAGVS